MNDTTVSGASSNFDDDGSVGAFLEHVQRFVAYPRPWRDEMAGFTLHSITKKTDLVVISKSHTPIPGVEPSEFTIQTLISGGSSVGGDR